MNEAAQNMVHYQGKGPRVYKSYLIGVELLENCLDELRPIHEAHWYETEGYLGLPFNPDYKRMMHLERGYRYVVITARDENMNAVGNLSYSINNSLHHMGQLIASEDAIFLVEEHRKGGLCMEMLKFAEEVFRNIGVNSLTLGDKTPLGGKNLAPVMKRLGYQPIMTGYHKSLGD